MISEKENRFSWLAGSALISQARTGSQERLNLLLLRHQRLVHWGVRRQWFVYKIGTISVLPPVGFGMDQGVGVGFWILRQPTGKAILTGWLIWVTSMLISSCSTFVFVPSCVSITSVYFTMYCPSIANQ